MPAPVLLFQKVNVFINGRSAQITNPCQFRNIQLPAFICGIMPKEEKRECCLWWSAACRSACPWPWRSPSLTAHWSSLALPAVQRDTAHNHGQQKLCPYNVNKEDPFRPFAGP